MFFPILELQQFSSTLSLEGVRARGRWLAQKSKLPHAPLHRKDRTVYNRKVNYIVNANHPFYILRVFNLLPYSVEL